MLYLHACVFFTRHRMNPITDGSFNEFRITRDSSALKQDTTIGDKDRKKRSFQAESGINQFNLLKLLLFAPISHFYGNNI
jgi:hypothetical protein